MPDVANIKIGVCNVTYKGVNLGHTLGGVKVTYKPEYEDINADQYGKSPVDKVLIGEVIEVKVPLAETTLANLAKAIPNSSGTDPVKIGRQAGAKLGTSAGELLLHPISVTGTSEDLVIYKAVITGDVELPYEVDKERVMEVTFEALVDTTKADGNLYGHIGTIS